MGRSLINDDTRLLGLCSLGHVELYPGLIKGNNSVRLGEKYGFCFYSACNRVDLIVRVAPCHPFLDEDLGGHLIPVTDVLRRCPLVACHLQWPLGCRSEDVIICLQETTVPILPKLLVLEPLEI